MQNESYIGSMAAICLACDRLAFVSDIFCSQESLGSETNVSESIFYIFCSMEIIGEIEDIMKNNGYHRTQTTYLPNMKSNMIESYVFFHFIQTKHKLFIT